MRSAFSMMAMATTLLVLPLGAGCGSRTQVGEDSTVVDEARSADEDGLAGAGISAELATERKRITSRVHYELSIRLAKVATEFNGRCRITFDLSLVPPALILDFKGRRIDDLKVNDKAADWKQTHDHVVIDPSSLVVGTNHVELDYESGVGAAGEGLIAALDKDDDSRYVYTLNVPSDGHAVLPCFDQPDLKARFSLEVAGPADWTVIANAPLIGDPIAAADGTRTWRFQATEEISTYLFAFAAGPFTQIVDEGGDGARRLRFFGRRSQRALMEKHAADIFKCHRDALGFLEDYFKVPYPFAKLDFVCVPDFPFGGMEHVGCIFYGEDPLMFRTEVTRLRESRRADLIAHEVAHQWFGDLVTMPWFDDVWLKEGFATFMAHKALEATFGGIDHPRNFFLRIVPSALDTDTTSGATPIRQPLGNLRDAKSNYGPIIYRKGPAVLQQLEYLIGDEAFRDGVEMFLQRYRFGCGAWEQLEACFEETGKVDLADWSAAWIEGAGVPEIQASLVRGSNGGPPTLRLTQRSLDGSARRWPLGLEAAAYGAGGEAKVFPVRTSEADIAIGTAGESSSFAFANAGGQAYALFTLDAESRAYVVANFDGIKGGLLRAMLWECLWAEVQRAALSPSEYLAFALPKIFGEDDQRLVSTILGHVATCLSRYLSDSDRLEWAKKVEAELLGRMNDGALDKDYRLLAMRAFFSSCHSERGRAALHGLLRAEIAPEGIEIATRDRWAMATRLVLLGDPEADDWVQRLTAEDPGDEGRRRAFIAECARPDPAIKAELFRRFRDDEELPERWVQNGAATFFASATAELSDQFLVAALEQLDWIKENRKIFFLAAWIDAAVRSRLGADAVGVVEDYLARPTTQRDVAMKLRVALDHLKRTVRIRKRY